MKQVLLICSILMSGLYASAAERPDSQVDPAALKKWQDLRFGMFIHWGPVSLTGYEIGWSRGSQTPIEAYDQLYKQFNPVQFDADEWVRVAKDAGMKYVVLTTKHHDGFCLWDTKQTDYNIMNSPFNRDVVRELASACRRQGMAFGTYYSTCDWHHPDFPLTSPGGRVRREQSNLDRYTEYLKAQVTELLVNYGPLVTLWFDVPQEFDKQRGQQVIDMVRSIQPDIVINNRTGALGDYDTPEQRIGDFNRQRPWETCMTICRQWAWKPDDDMKSLSECIRTLLQTVGGDGNLLFNVGPMPDGRIEPRQVDRLKEMGRWVQKHAEGIYGTRGGPYKPGSWGASTCKNTRVYLFVMDWPAEGPLQLAPLPMKITKAALLNGQAVSVQQSHEAVELEVPADQRDPIATCVELTVDGQAVEIEPLSVVRKSGSLAFMKRAAASNVYHNQLGYAPDRAFDDDPETRWATDEGTASAWLQVDLGAERTVRRAMIDERGWDRVRKFEIRYRDGSEWKVACQGDRIGDNKEITFAPVHAGQFQLWILESTEGPTIWEFQLFE